MNSPFHLGLTGHPLGHSLSPKIHAAALKACGLRGDYSLFPIHPDDRQGLAALLARVRRGELHGLNVTIPHKQNVIPFLDELTPTAQAIGAVNTIYRHESKLVGHNTDAAGFLADLKRTLPSVFRPPRSALILGAGGAARSVVYSLLADGWNATLAARRIEQAEQLASTIFNTQLSIASFADLHSASADFSRFSLIVNATPLGMSPDVERSPLPKGVMISSTTAIYDLLYNPRQTRLVSDALAWGCLAVTGLGMLIEQAALAFEVWTGCNPPRVSLRAAVE